MKISNWYCWDHLTPAVKLYKLPVILDDVTHHGDVVKNQKCEWASCPRSASVKVRFYKNPPKQQFSAAAIV